MHCISGLGVEGDSFFFPSRDWIIYQSVLSGKQGGKKKEKKKSKLASGVWYAVCVALPIYSYKISCSSSGEGIYKHRNVDCRKLLKEGSCLHRRWFLAEWEDVYSSSAFILGRLCHPCTQDEIADDYEFTEFINVNLT